METHKSHQKLESFSQRKNCNKTTCHKTNLSPWHSKCIISQFFSVSSPFSSANTPPKTSGYNLKNHPFEPENHLPNPPFFGIFMANSVQRAVFTSKTRRTELQFLNSRAMRRTARWCRGAVPGSIKPL